MRPFAGERFWVLRPGIALAALLTGVAYRLQPRRDVGAGLVPPRPGPATAAAGLRSPLALAWRLHRGPLLGWTIAMLVIGGVFGAIATGIGDLVGSSDQTRQIFERMGGAQAHRRRLHRRDLRHLRADRGGLLGPGDAADAQRGVGAAAGTAARHPRDPRPLGGEPPGVRGTGPALLLLAAGLGTGLTYGLRISDVGAQVPHVLGATLAQLPAVLVMAALAALLFGFLPNLTAVSWGVLTVFLLITLFGPILQLNQSVLDVSPFSHVPKLPTAEFTATPLVWLTGIAVVVFAGALTGFRRRDIG